MVLIPKLKGKITECGFSRASLAKELNIDKSTFYRKLNSSGDNFTVGEAGKLAQLLSLSKEEAAEIFFGDTVA